MSVKCTIKELDAGQLDLMWQFLQMGHQKANITALKENCDLLRQAMIQKNAGQRGDNRNYVSFDDLGTIINCIVIEAMCLYLSGKLDQIEETSDDAVSRADAIDAVGLGDSVRRIKDRIAKLPSVQPERKTGKWIPCSERLPKIGKEVLLSEPNDTFLAEYYGNGNPEGVWYIDGIHHYLQDIKGCAWMPLPEPYREEGGKNE